MAGDYQRFDHNRFKPVQSANHLRLNFDAIDIAAENSITKAIGGADRTAFSRSRFHDEGNVDPIRLGFENCFGGVNGSDCPTEVVSEPRIAGLERDLLCCGQFPAIHVGILCRTAGHQHRQSYHLPHTPPIYPETPLGAGSSRPLSSVRAARGHP